MPSITAETPWLALAALPALVALVYSIRRGGLGRGAFRAGQWLCLAAALAGLAFARKAVAPVEIVAIDLSGSHAPRLDAVERFLNEAGAPAEALYFGAAARRGPYPPPQGFLDNVAMATFRSQTRVDTALETLLATTPAGARVLLFTDGLCTAAADIGPLLRRLAERDIRCYPILADGGRVYTEAAIGRVDYPDTAEPGRSAPLTVELLNTGETAALLELVVGGEVVHRQGFDLAAPSDPSAVRRTHVGLTLPMPADGPAEATVRLRPQHDTLAQNNTAAIRIDLRGVRRIVALTSPSARAALSAALGGLPGASVDVRTPAEFDPPQHLADAGMVIVYDVPHRNLPPGFTEHLTRAVRDRGAGFLMAGGPNSFATGGYADTDIEPLLPVRCQPPDKDLALVVALDTSGSMAAVEGGATRMELARAGTLALVRQLMGRDAMALVTFNGAPTVRLPMTRHPSDTEAARALAPVMPYGPTDIVAALDKALELLRDADSENRHIVVLSDGICRSGNVGPAIASAAEAGITMSAVATGDDINEALMRSLAEGTGGRYYALARYRDVGDAFLDDLRQQRGELFETEPRRLETATGLPPGALDRPLGPYSVRGLNAVDPRDAARTWLATGEGEAALVVGAAGRGQSAAWAVDVFSRGNEDFLASAESGALWRLLVDRLAGAPTPPGLTVASERLGPNRVTLSATRFDDGRPVGGLTLTAVVTRAGTEPEALPLHPVAPGRYEAAWGNASPEAMDVALIDETDGVGGPLWRGRIGPWRGEWDRWLIDYDRLDRIATLTGGRLVRTMAELDDVRAIRRRGYQPLRTAALAALLALMVAELAWSALTRRR